MSDWPEASADAWLWRVLQKDKNRLMVARLEDTLAAFLADPAQPSLHFPPRSAFHRKVCFAVAKRYHLDHRLEACPAGLSLVLLKTPSSAVPADRLDAFAKAPIPPDPATAAAAAAAAPQLQAADDSALPAPPAMFLRRSHSDPRKLPIAGAAAQNNPGAAVKSITEEDYQKARARIFKPAQQPAEHPNIVKLPTVAKGPTPGTTGFERRRRRPGGPPEKRTMRRQQHQQQQRDGNDDLQDPDFDRRYDKWALRQPAPLPVFGQLLYPYPMPVHPAHVGVQIPVVFAREEPRAAPNYGLDSTVDFPPLP